MPAIDHASPIPLYFQLKQLIKGQVERGELRPGQQIPTEAELCQRFRMSRTPVRQALLELTREGVLQRSAGRGTFVAPRPQPVLALRLAVPDERWQRLLETAADAWRTAGGSGRLELAFELIPLNQLHDQLALAVATGNAPDISVLDSVWVAEFASRRYIYPLAELDAAWTGRAGADIYPALVESNRFRGQLYAVPTNGDAAGLWYRRDWLAAEGLAPPADWDGLLQVGRHFQQPAVRRRYGLGPHPFIFAAGRAGGETTTYQLLPLLWANAGRIISDGQVSLDSPAVHQALDFLQGLVAARLAPPEVVAQPWDGTWRAFAAGQAALALGGTYESFLIAGAAGWKQAEFSQRAGFAPIPAGPAGRPSSLAGGMTLVVYRQSRRPAEALALLKQAVTTPVLKPFSLETGQHPAYRSVAQALGPEEDGFLRQTASLLQQAGNRPALPAYDRLSAQFQEMVELCLRDGWRPEAAAQRAAERIAGITGLPVAAAGGQGPKASLVPPAA
ncbi:MAG: extracellular solute-binding protein [Candidatus Promineifilaceae bacterium]